MSFRRRSCEACFKGKRKCDSAAPVCTRCQRTGKECHYIYPLDSENGFYKFTERQSSVTKRRVLEPSAGKGRTLDIPNLLGHLGEVRPIIGQAKSWEWLIQEFKSFPVSFGQTGEAGFIHKGAYAECANSLRTAYGLCLAQHMSTNDESRSSLMQMMADEVVRLLNTPSDLSLLDELAQLQALVLYQITRLLTGDLEQRIMAEYQESTIEHLSLQMLSRVTTEIGLVATTWEEWLIVESVRRTAIVAFMLYCLHLTHTLGVSTCFSAMARLPVSTRHELWESPQSFTPEVDNSLSYQAFADSWAAYPFRQLQPFEKMLMVPCKGLDTVESYVVGVAA